MSSIFSTRWRDYFKQDLEREESMYVKTYWTGKRNTISYCLLQKKQSAPLTSSGQPVQDNILIRV